MPRQAHRQTSEAILARLKRLHPREIDLSLGRIRRLLAALDHPERDLAPVVHVAGTNGKGSVIAFLRAMAESAGLRPNVYTSPHLVRFTERIRPAGRIIGDRALARLLRQCEAANDGAPITFFEITTAAAFLAFARTRADLTLLETGLGGRLDATNVVARPALSVITPVSLDHQRFLGTRLTQIAQEKAGILKPRVPAVIGPQHRAAAEAIAQRAAALDVPLSRWGREFTARLSADGLIFSDGDGELRLPKPRLAGPHQIANAAVAIAAAKALKRPKIGVEGIARGLERATWPARLQHLGSGPLTEALAAKGFTVLLDGGHNPAAGRALARAMAEADTGPLYLIVGMVGPRDAEGFLAPLARCKPRGLWAVPVPAAPAALPPAELADSARRVGIPAYRSRSVKTALNAVGRRRPGRVLITGSLYLAGAVLAEDGAAV